MRRINSYHHAVLTYIICYSLCIVLAFVRSVVDSSLFSATLATQQAILLVRSLCERACSSITGVGEKEHAICLLYVDHQTTFTLADFVEAQARQAEEAKEKLAKLRSNVLEIVKDACEVCFLCCKGKYYYF